MKEHVHGGDIYRYGNVLDFSSNINPFGTPDGVVEAIQRAALTVGGYPDVECRKLKKKISDKTGINSDCIFCGNGAAEVIFAITAALRPERALVQSPAFAEYEQALSACGCKTEYFLLDEKKDFVPGEDFIDAVTEDYDIVFLCNPNNPTGVLLDREYVTKVARRCKEKKAYFVLDECFLDFVEDPYDKSMLKLLDEFPDMIILKAFTKLYAMAGVRLGYGLCSSDKIIGLMDRSIQPWNVSSIAQAAGIAALDEEKYVADSLPAIRRERARMISIMKNAGFKVFESAANYIFFKGPDDLFETCLKQGILLRDCSNYRGLAKGYYRAAVRLENENDILLEALTESIKEGE